MKQYFALLKLQLLARFSTLNPRRWGASPSEKKGKGALKAVAYVVLFGYLLGLLIYLENALLGALISMGMPDLLLTIAVMVAMLGTLVMGFFFILSTLYFGRDAAFIASLPVKTHTVLAAKISQVWLSETGVAAVFLLPAGILYGIRVHPEPLFYLRLALVWLGAAALPIVAVAWLSTLLIRLSALWKRREMVATVGGIVLLIAYMYLCMNLGSLAGGDGAQEYLIQFLSSNQARIQSMARVFPPAGWAANGLLGDWAQLMLFLAIGFGGLILTVWLLGYSYRTLSMLQSETPAAQGRKGKMPASLSASSPFRACCRREIKQILRVPSYATNILPMSFMPLLMVGVMALSMSRAMAQEGDTVAAVLEGVGGGTVLAVMAAVMCFMAGMNPAFSSAVTREGKGHPYMTCLPVSARTVVLSKLAVGMGLSLIGCLPAAVLLGVLVPGCLIQAALAFVLTALFCFITGCIALANDTAHPKLDWLTETEAIKQKAGMGTLISMMVNWAILAALGVISFFLLRAGAGMLVYFACIGGLLLLAALLAWRWLLHNADTKYCQD